MENPHQKLAIPKKKRRCYQEKEAPFPVPIASVTGVAASNDKWCYYTGQLVNNYVEVSHSGDMEFLHKMGFFGKGTLSRHDLAQNTGRRIYTRKGRKFEGRQLKVISRRKYLRRLAWQHYGEGASKAHLDLPTDKLPLREPAPHPSPGNAHAIPRVTADVNFETESPFLQSSDVIKDQEMGSKDNSIPEVDDPWGNPVSEVENPWGNSKTEDPWEMTTEEESVAFWGMDTTSTVPVANQRKPIAEERETSNDISNDKESDVIDNFNSDSISDVNTYERLKPEKDISFNVEHSNVRPLCTEDKLYVAPDAKSVSIIDKNATEKVSSLKQSDQRNKTHKKTRDTEQLTLDKDSKLSVDMEDIHVNNEVRPGDVMNTADDDIDPRCLSDHEDGSLFVVNDTDESDPEMSGNQPRLKWEPAVKRNPFNLKETLHLTFEEAFFLSYGLGCLVVLDDCKKPMKLSQLWKTFCERQVNFLRNYIAYHNFRSKGWVPKPGIKFGGDFVLYKDGPPFYHSTYVVMVRSVDGGSLKEINMDKHRKLTWTSLAGQNRITEQASKELMICYVIHPTNLSVEDLQSPRCITHFKIQEMCVKRWLLKHERENVQYMEIP